MAAKDLCEETGAAWQERSDWQSGRDAAWHGQPGLTMLRLYGGSGTVKLADQVGLDLSLS